MIALSEMKYINIYFIELDNLWQISEERKHKCFIYWIFCETLTYKMWAVTAVLGLADNSRELCQGHTVPKDLSLMLNSLMYSF